jgi:hypothetical protein
MRPLHQLLGHRFHSFDRVRDRYRSERLGAVVSSRGQPVRPLLEHRLRPAASADRGSRLDALRRRNEIEVEVLVFGEAHELPPVGEGAAIAGAKLVEYDAAGRADAGRRFQ